MKSVGEHHLCNAEQIIPMEYYASNSCSLPLFFTLKNKFAYSGQLPEAGNKAGEEMAMLSVEGCMNSVTCRTQGGMLTSGYAFKEKELGVLRIGWQGVSLFFAVRPGACLIWRALVVNVDTENINIQLSEIV
jgi:hypothetical protein